MFDYTVRQMRKVYREYGAIESFRGPTACGIVKAVRIISHLTSVELSFLL